MRCTKCRLLKRVWAHRLCVVLLSCVPGPGFLSLLYWCIKFNFEATCPFSSAFFAMQSQKMLFNRNLLERLFTPPWLLVVSLFLKDALFTQHSKLSVFILCRHIVVNYKWRTLYLSLIKVAYCACSWLLFLFKKCVHLWLKSACISSSCIIIGLIQRIKLLKLQSCG